MRISDWSSDVCSSDLLVLLLREERGVDRDEGRGEYALAEQVLEEVGDLQCRAKDVRGGAVAEVVREHALAHEAGDAEIGRASCREGVCQSCRSRWSPSH